MRHALYRTVFLLLAVTLSARAQDASLSPTRSTLANGLTVLVVEQRGLPLTAVRLVVLAGSAFDPPGKEGVAALTALLLDKGAGNRSASQVAETVDFRGGTLEVDHTHDATFVTASMLSRDTDVFLELMADMVIRPSLAEEEYLRERENLLASLARTQENASYLTDVFFNRFLFGAHPYGRPELGADSSVARLTREDIVAFHRSWYVPNNAFMIIAGDVHTTDVMRTARRLFEGWRKRPLPRTVFAAPPAVNGFSLHVVDKPDLSQTHVRMGTLALPRNHPDHIPMAVASTILGGGFSSRLVSRIRVDRGLTYDIRSRIAPRRERGAFVVSTFTKTETTGEMVEAVLEELRQFRRTGVTEADVLAARQYLSGVFPLSLQGPRALTDQIVDMELYGLPADYLRTYTDRLRAVTVGEVARVIRRYVPDNEAILCVLLGPADRIIPQIEHFGTVRRHSMDVQPVEP